MAANSMKKTTPKVNTDVEIQSEDFVKNTTQKKETIKTAKKKTFGANDYILCTSVWPGGLHVSGISGMIYDFKNINSTALISYNDLSALIRTGSDDIFLPRIIINDDDFLEEFPTVTALYNDMYTVKDLEKILELPNDEMKHVINSLPKTVKNSMMNLISTDIANGKIDSVRKIRALTEIFDSDFNLISELFVR